MFSEKGWQWTISRAPPGIKPTCLPDPRAREICFFVASITFPQSAVVQPTVGMNLPSELWAMTNLFPNRSGRLSNVGNIDIGYLPWGWIPRMQGFSGTSALLSTQKPLVLARFRRMSIHHLLRRDPTAAGATRRRKGIMRIDFGITKKRLKTTQVTRGTPTSHHQTRRGLGTLPLNCTLNAIVNNSITISSTLFKLDVFALVMKCFCAVSFYFILRWDLL